MQGSVQRRSNDDDFSYDKMYVLQKGRAVGDPLRLTRDASPTSACRARPASSREGGPLPCLSRAVRLALVTETRAEVALTVPEQQLREPSCGSAVTASATPRRSHRPVLLPTGARASRGSGLSSPAPARHWAEREASLL